MPTMVDFTAPDYSRCQCEITTHNPWAFGGGTPQTRRCMHVPSYLITEVKAGKYGERGSMTLCNDCYKVFVTQNKKRVRVSKLKKGKVVHIVKQPILPVMNNLDENGHAPLAAKLLAAFRIAYLVHAHQKDKAGKPYINHLLRVCVLVGDKSEDAQIVALLHDTLEDSVDHHETRKLIAQEFSPRIVNAVETLTKSKNEKYMDYVGRVSLCSLACEVKIADLTDNLDVERLEKITLKDSKRIEKYRKARRYLVEHLIREKPQIEMAFDVKKKPRRKNKEA